MKCPIWTGMSQNNKISPYPFSFSSKFQQCAKYLLESDALFDFTRLSVLDFQTLKQTELPNRTHSRDEKKGTVTFINKLRFNSVILLIHC